MAPPMVANPIIYQRVLVGNSFALLASGRRPTPVSHNRQLKVCCRHFSGRGAASARLQPRPTT